MQVEACGICFSDTSCRMPSTSIRARDPRGRQRVRRNDEQLETVVHDRNRDISYAGCGLAHYIGGQVDDAYELHPPSADRPAVHQVGVFAVASQEVRSVAAVRALAMSQGP